jgi:hypothetical protein
MCGRAGQYQLANEVIAALRTGHHRLQEYHIAPVVEAFCKAGQVQEAVEAVCMAVNEKIEPLRTTCEPLSSLLTESYKNVDLAVDKLRRICARGESTSKPVHVNLANAILRACVARRELSRAVELYRRVFPELGVEPNADTLNALLEGCISTMDDAMALKLVTEMTGGGGPRPLRPNLETHELMIMLPAKTEPRRFDIALARLKRLDSLDLVASRNLYVRLAFAMAAAGDRRAVDVLEEMVAKGHRQSRALRDQVTNTLRRTTPLYEAEKANAAPSSSSGKEDEWVEDEWEKVLVPR